jgi:hypothetical protein
VQIEQLRHVVGRHASHPALGADTPLALSGCGLRQRGLDLLRLLVARAIGLVVRVVRDEREVQLGLRSGRQVAQRGELAGVIPGLGHGERHPVDRPLCGEDDAVDEVHLHLDRLALYATMTRQHGLDRGLLFASGYLLVWGSAGLGAYGVFRLGLDVFGGDLAWHAGGRWFAAGVLALAAVYEITPLKDVAWRSAAVRSDSCWGPGGTGGLARWRWARGMGRPASAERGEMPTSSG